MKNRFIKSKKSLPGDNDFPEETWSVDQSIFVHASAEEIWPWLAQMGNDRGGWYSYDWLDNFGKQSFEHIEPSLQNIVKDQKLKYCSISDFKVNEFITFKFGDVANFTLVLIEKNMVTKLVTRVRCKGPKALLSFTLGPGHFIMQRKQLLEIKRRAER